MRPPNGAWSPGWESVSYSNERMGTYGFRAVSEGEQRCKESKDKKTSAVICLLPMEHMEHQYHCDTWISLINPLVQLTSVFLWEQSSPCKGTSSLLFFNIGNGILKLKEKLPYLKCRMQDDTPEDMIRKQNDKCCLVIYGHCVHILTMDKLDGFPQRGKCSNCVFLIFPSGSFQRDWRPSWSVP